MKKLIIGAIALISLNTIADTLCTVHCVKTLSMPLQEAKVADVYSTLYKSSEDNITKVMMLELENHCEKVSPGSRAIGVLPFGKDGILKVQEINDTNIHVGEYSCINL